MPKVKSDNGLWNALMYGIRYRSATLEILFPQLEALSPAEQGAILVRVDKSGMNALICSALYFNLQVFKRLCLLIVNIPQEYRIIILTQMTDWIIPGSVFTFACLEYPEAAIQLWKLMQTFDLENQLSIINIMQLDNRRWHHLVAGIYDQPQLLRNFYLLLRGISDQYARTEFLADALKDLVDAHPESTEKLWEFLQTFDPAEQPIILMKALIRNFASFYSVPSITLMLTWVQRFDTETQAEMVKMFQEDTGKNVLMLAVCNYTSETLAQLLTWLQTFDRSAQVKMQKHNNDADKHALILAVSKYIPDALEQLLTWLQPFDQSDQIETLMHVNKKGMSALMIAASQCATTKLAHLLSRVRTFDRSDQVKSFMQLDRNGRNVFMHALANKKYSLSSREMQELDELLIQLCSVLQTFDETDQVRILLQLDKDGWNILMFAAYLPAECIQSLCEVIEQLSAENKKLLLDQTYRYLASIIAKLLPRVESRKQLVLALSIEPSATAGNQHVFWNRFSAKANYIPVPGSDLKQPLLTGCST